jgi:hypothetical protein
LEEADLTFYQLFLNHSRAVLDHWGTFVRPAKLSAETVYLRDFARMYAREISLSPRAERDLAACPGIGLAEVLYVLERTTVISSEKEEAEGAYWVVSGRTCEECGLVLSLQVWCDRYRIRVLRVSLMGANDV